MNNDAEILGIFRSHILMLIGKWIIILLLVLIIFFCTLIFLPRDLINLSAFTVFLILITSGMIVTSFTHWWVNTDTIIGDRLLCIRLHGIFHYSVDTIPHRKVQSVDFHQEGMLQNVFGFGNIYISSELFGEPGKYIILRNISQHHKLVELLRSQSDVHYQ